MKILKVDSVFDKNLMPSKGECCVYSLLDKNKKVVYVGQSVNLKQRVFSHLSSDKEFSYIKWCICKKDEMNNIEAKGIVNSKSPKNKTLPPNDLYMSTGLMHRSALNKIKNATKCFDVVFTTSNKSNYINTSDYDLFMSLVDDFVLSIEKLKAEVK